METASFNGFLKTIIYLIAFYYIFKILFRIFLPILLKKAVHKAGQNFQQQTRHYQDTQFRSPNDIHVDTSKAAKSREKKKVGEYVDYEELDN